MGVIIDSPTIVIAVGSDKAGPDDVRDENTAAIALQRLIDEHVTRSHSQYKKASELISKHTKTKNVEHFLRLYSLETSFTST